MKHFNLILISFFFVGAVGAQVTNTRQSVWSDTTAWSNNAIPGVDDDVTLLYDIVIDEDAYCRSFNLNGHNATVETGANLYVTGINDNADTLLSRYVVVDTTVFPADTFQTIDFFYDSLKRNTLMIERFFASGGGIDYQFSRTFFYNANERLPYKYENANGNERFFNYQNGRLVRDSSINYVTTYTYLPNAVIKQIVDNNQVISTETFYVRRDGNGDIVYQTDTSISNGIREYNYVFDSHPNPFRSTQINCWRAVNQEETFIEESFAKSNMLQVRQTHNFGSYRALYGYGYKANGYPKEIWGYDVENPGEPGAGKALFIYTR